MAYPEAVLKECSDIFPDMWPGSLKQINCNIIRPGGSITGASYSVFHFFKGDIQAKWYSLGAFSFLGVINIVSCGLSFKYKPTQCFYSFQLGLIDHSFVLKG
jgi:hypothetical protein